MYAYLWKKHGIKNETNENKTAKGIVFLKSLECASMFLDNSLI
jgi:hypothetical protein